MKKCIRCLIEKELSMFHKDSKRKDKLSPYCKQCVSEMYLLTRSVKSKQRKEWRDSHKDILRAAAKKRYEENKEHYLALARAVAKKRRTRIRKDRQNRKEDMVAFLGGVCQICGLVVHPAAFDFHHRNPKEKEYDVKTLTSCSWERITKELNKCDLLCANCHRVFHFNTGGNDEVCQ